MQLGPRTGLESVAAKGKNPCLRRDSSTVVPVHGQSLFSLAPAYSVHYGNVGRRMSVWSLDLSNNVCVLTYLLHGAESFLRS